MRLLYGVSSCNDGDDLKEEGAHTVWNIVSEREHCQSTR